MTPETGEPAGTGTDLAALHEALDAGARAAFSAEYGDAEGTSLALKQATAASELAFPAGSGEGLALSAVLDVIRACVRAPDGGGSASGGGCGISGGACEDAADPDLWYRRGSEEEAKAVCGGCPVRIECLEYAVASDEEYGIWGGFDPGERRLLRDYGNPLECGGCGQLKPVTEFGSDGHGGYRETCLACRAGTERKNRQRRKERYAAAALPAGHGGRQAGGARRKASVPGRKETTSDDHSTA